MSEPSKFLALTVIDFRNNYKSAAIFMVNTKKNREILQLKQ